jgi:hypothetical protein
MRDELACRCLYSLQEVNYSIALRWGCFLGDTTRGHTDDGGTSGAANVDVERVGAGRLMAPATLNSASPV